MPYLEDILKESFLDYSAFILQRRALPDVRDMLKYTARQILHAQYKEKLDHKHPFKKSQKSTSAATSFSYVHGDTSAYGQIIRMGRSLVQRYFLEDIVGGSGSPTEAEDYAAPRYTEARLSELSAYLFDKINEDTVISNDWAPTYDEEGTFPLVLPSLGYYNICNGSFGSIGVGLVSSIPQFNLKEVNQEIISLIRDSSKEVQLNPDFASGGILLNPETTHTSLSIGYGKSALLRGKVRHFDKEGYVQVYELPYGVYTNTICEEIEKFSEHKECPIDKIKDLSKDEVNIRVYGDNLWKIEKWLYKNTSVQKHFTIKLTFLVGGKVPKLLTLKEALLEHIKHTQAALRRALEFQLQKLKIRQEIIEGLLKAYSIIDEIIQLAKTSQSRADLIFKLTTTFSFSKIQAEAIADIKLHRLSKIDVQSLKDELKQNLSEQQHINGLLVDNEKFNDYLIGFYVDVSNKFGDNRRTEIYRGNEFEVGQDGTATNETFMLDFTNKTYTAVSEKDREVSQAFSIRVEPDDQVIILTDTMRGFVKNSKDFILGTNDWSELIKLNQDEKILFAIKKDELERFEYVEVKDDTGKQYSIHKSFILNRASQRGKRLTTKKYNIIQIHLTEEKTSFPSLR